MMKLKDEPYIDDTFLDEQVLAASQVLTPWFADFANYFASDVVPKDLSFKNESILCLIHKFFWGLSHTFF